MSWDRDGVAFRIWGVVPVWHCSAGALWHRGVHCGAVALRCWGMAVLGQCGAWALGCGTVGPGCTGAVALRCRGNALIVV